MRVKEQETSDAVLFVRRHRWTTAALQSPSDGGFGRPFRGERRISCSSLHHLIELLQYAARLCRNTVPTHHCHREPDVGYGGTATFTVGATGTPPLSYQWQKNGADIAGANATSYISSGDSADSVQISVALSLMQPAIRRSQRCAVLSVTIVPVITVSLQARRL